MHLQRIKRKLYTDDLINAVVIAARSGMIGWDRPRRARDTARRGGYYAATIRICAGVQRSRRDESASSRFRVFTILRCAVRSSFSPDTNKSTCFLWSN